MGLFKIRYCTENQDYSHNLDKQSTGESARSHDLDIYINAKALKAVHRLAWMNDEDPDLVGTWGQGYVNRVRELRQEYTRAFTENTSDNA